ncbi:ParA family protein [Anaeromyxobacter oryzisoli]|jgi:chromosome partitioning protein|uniref:ParA family protein n=1 Tax=Anaeromyxobacter oryzisoli TaxID=2925408 RepID=UPI001F59E4BD|nr:ParA family protein [Anaeromyxobacter sp. SG63]
MRRIAFINEKGGTCKTTLCVNVAARLAARGQRVLVVDLDTQGHAGKSLGVDVRDLSPTVHDWLLDYAIGFDDVVRPTGVENLDLVPANKDLAAFPVAVAPAPDRADRLDQRLATIRPGRYDVVLLDAPPSLSLVTENVLRAARELVVPVALTYLALDGCAEIVRSLERLRAERGRAPELLLVVPTLYRKTQLADEILARLQERFPETLSRTVLGWSVKVDEAQSHGRTIFEYAPRSSGAAALAALGDEILARAPALRSAAGA